MSHTYHKIWLHYIWATKYRKPLITKNLKIKLNGHIKKNAKDNDIYIDTVNGIVDHIHLLVGLYPSQCPSYIANMIKGESSNWINKNDFIKQKFAWQGGYSVFSVSESNVQKVREYIMNQEEHHKKMTYEEEIEKFLKVYGIKKQK
jgi:REP element-mobilizing transposase RayT